MTRPAPKLCEDVSQAVGDVPSVRLRRVASVCERGVVLSHGKVLMDGEINEAIAFVRELTNREI